MRGKRSKQYKKLMNAYAHTFGFRAPYQVLVDSDIVLDATKHKMELVKGLEKCLHGTLKPMISQCSIRHLYTLPTAGSKSSSSTSSSSPDPPATLTKAQKDAAIDLAKTFERRRCGHHTLDEPLSNFDCIQSCLVSPSGGNKNHYVVATQSRDLRAYLRSIPGVPLMYINRSVMIMEPMADVSWEKREREEWGKFTIGIKDSERRAVEASARGEAADREREKKRKRGEEDGDEGKEEVKGVVDGLGVAAAPAIRRRKGPRGPNPLSVKKKKALPVRYLPNPTKKKVAEGPPAKSSKVTKEKSGEEGGKEEGGAQQKKKRKRKHGGSNSMLKQSNNGERADLSC